MSLQPIVRLEGIEKTFGPVRALAGVDLTILPREIHGLVGGNGAGKTTLMNVLYGLYRPDSGTVSLRGAPTEIRSPKDAIAHGIGMVHQHFLQVNNFTVLDNIVLGAQGLHNRPTLKLGPARSQIEALSRRFGLDVDPHARIEDLPMGARQRVEILKALYRGADVLILDEPTTNLTPQEVDSLFESLQRMVAEDMSVVFITHKLREVMAVCGTVSVLRNGRHVFTKPRSEVNETDLVLAMVGADMTVKESMLFAGRADEEAGVPVEGEIALVVDGVSAVEANGVTVLDNVSFALREGEILGVAGVAGNGQQELVEVIVGVRAANAGRVKLGDREITSLNTRERLDLGIAYVPEDRQQDGFLPTASVAHNLILGSHRRADYHKGRLLNWQAVYKRSAQLIREYNIRTQSAKDTAANLSGGNIQRMMLARAFDRTPRLLILHNPTSGLDIASVEGVYNQLLAYKDEGVATLLLSDDLDELMLMSDRMAVMYRGAVVGILARSAFDKYEIGRMMGGTTHG
ncbi:MAG: ABC transporter ATP-binding protein [Caldilineales bacterium]|nr:ABC transporter ATP-binding protein [Caldilineales bacterium]